MPLGCPAFSILLVVVAILLLPRSSLDSRSPLRDLTVLPKEWISLWLLEVLE